MDNEEARIFSINGERRGLLKKNPDDIRCYHSRKVFVDEKNRTVECAECGALLDPFNYLLKLANKNETAWNMKARWEKEAEEAAERLSDLERKERNTKQRLKRAREKLNGISSDE